MTFTKTCFIRKNTPELRNKLKELGYEPSEWVSDDNELCLATGMDKFTTIGEYAKSKNQMNIMWTNRDYVHTKEEVLKKVEDMRLRKIESLKKQIVKLEKMKF